MCRSYRISAIASLLVAAAAAAQDADPKELCQKADTATKALKAVSYKVEVFGLDGETRREMFKGAVRLRNDKEKTETGIPSLRIEGAARGPDGEIQVDLTTDGKDVLVIDKAKKLARRIPADRTGDDRAVQSVLQLAVMREFSHPNPFGDEVNGEKQTLEGKKTINGVECNVILVKYSVQAAEARWFFGVKDSLPRRVERLGERRYIVELADLNPDPKLDPDAFALKVPTGFDEDAPGILTKGRAAPAFSLATADGKNVSLSELKDKVVVLAFWSSWNGPAKKALPIVQNLHKTFGGGKNVAVFGVQVWEDTDPTGFLKENNYTFPTLVKGDKVAESYKIEKLPVFFVIGTDGKIQFSAVGIDDKREAEITKAIEAAGGK